MPKINKTVLMTGAEYFDDGDAINVLMDSSIPVDVEAAIAEHATIKVALESAGIKVIKIATPPKLQDAVYTANWALVRNGKALMARLPNTRQPEEAYALQAVKDAGLEPLTLPDEVERFSGQGDALACGDIVFTQSPFRTTTAAHKYLKDWMGFSQVISLKTKPARRFGSYGPAIVNEVTGWPDSPTYDIDLAIAILKCPEYDKNGKQTKKGLIAWCPDVFQRPSRKIMRQFDGVDKIEVSRREAMGAYAMNMVSTGKTAIMNAGAPLFAAELEARGLQVITLDLPELRKGGGSIRCSTLSLDN